MTLFELTSLDQAFAALVPPDKRAAADINAALVAAAKRSR